MAIVPLKKITLVALQAERPELLAMLQAQGNLHLIDLGAKVEATDSISLPKQTVEALRFLFDAETLMKPWRLEPTADPTRLNQAVDDCLALKQRLLAMQDRLELVNKYIKALLPWGHFEFMPLETMAGLRLWFYAVPKHKMKQLVDSELCWQQVAEDLSHCYLVVVAAQEPDAQSMPVPRTHTGSESLGQLQAERDGLEQDIEELQLERIAMTRWRSRLAASLASMIDASNLQNAQHLCLNQGGLFVLQAWCPVAQEATLAALCRQQGCALISEAPTPADAPPTLLDNPGGVAAMADLVKLFQLPNYRGWDPSFSVFLSFALFFAMILADAGYAALLLVLLLIYQGKLAETERKRRFRTLAYTLVGGALVYGILLGSYFGVAPGPDTLLGWLAVLDISDFDAMMRLSIFVGVLHLVVANLLSFRHYLGQSPPTKAYAYLGWASLLLVGLLAWQLQMQGLLQGHLLTAFYLSLVPGGLLILLCSGAQPLNSWHALGARLLAGLKSMTGISKAFGDVLSYMRLFALGLSSAQLAMTFNQLAVQVLESLPGVGVLMFILILLLGHLLNFVLAVMSGVIHGLRLNFIEFFNWSLSDEGYPFKRFAKQEVTEWKP